MGWLNPMHGAQASAGVFWRGLSWLASELDMGTAAHASKHVGLLQRGGSQGKKWLEQLKANSSRES
jgi:hypothetical protein